MTEAIYINILVLIVDAKSDPRLLGKIYSLTGVFYFQKKEDLHMIVKDAKGNAVISSSQRFISRGFAE